jgi:hypothetical protein
VLTAVMKESYLRGRIQPNPDEGAIRSTPEIAWTPTC